jgi:hypothetical protein
LGIGDWGLGISSKTPADCGRRGEIAAFSFFAPATTITERSTEYCFSDAQ